MEFEPLFPNVDKDICVICLRTIFETDAKTNKKEEKLSCGHSFHQKCIDKWITYSATCPHCKAPIKVDTPLVGSPIKGSISENAQDIASRYKGGNTVSTEQMACIGHEEDIAHNLAYHFTKKFQNQEMKNGDLINLPDGTYHIMQYNDNNGLIAYILTGIDCDHPKMRVVFRGTADRASWKRNLFEKGIGELSYNHNKNTILYKLNDAIKTYLQDVPSSKQNALSLTVSGHSLGGVDAQRFFTTILGEIKEHYENAEIKQIANSKDYNCSDDEFIDIVKDYKYNNTFPFLSRIKEVSCFHFNAPGVSTHIAENAKNLLTLYIIIK